MVRLGIEDDRSDVSPLVAGLLAEKQPPEVLCKKGCSQKFSNIHRKVSLLEHSLKKQKDSLETRAELADFSL